MFRLIEASPAIFLIGFFQGVFFLSPSMALRLGAVAPDFKAETTQGPIEFHKFKQAKWAILFSHPEDFTPVCTTELGQVAKLQPQFTSKNTLVIGLSCNTLNSHQQWINDINETQNCDLKFPIIADADRKIATLYDMLDHQDLTNVDKKGMPLTVRSVFFIDAKNIIRTVLSYPASTGRNFDEVLRILDSLQLCDNHKVATPSNWNQGDDVIVHNSLSDEQAAVLFPGFKTIKPYLRTVSLQK
jgi:alkyl hydroperoxide reductase subunit AhpC